MPAGLACSGEMPIKDRPGVALQGPGYSLSISVSVPLWSSPTHPHEVTNVQGALNSKV